MSLGSRLIRSRLPGRTVRLRLTVVYGALFLLSGGLLLGVTYVLVQHAVENTSAKGSLAAPISGSAPPTPTAAPTGSGKLHWQGGYQELSAQAAQAMLHQRREVLHELFIQSWIALAIMALISVALGWVMAGRSLRPLRTITATARDISATSLHRRLALDGPADELKELGDTFDDLLGRLEASFDAQRSFVANASHELRTPLARQRALGQVALADPDATADTLREAHRRILAAGAQQERLIEALLTLARGHAGLDVREPFDLGQVAAAVVESRKTDARELLVTITSSINSAPVAGHRNLAERLVTNLVDNALRYNRSHGTVEVTVAAEDGKAVLSVANTGPAVPPEAVDRLYQPFQRLSDTRAARSEGLGLGLSIVAAIAEAHGAALTTTARPEGGLLVTATFPALAGHHRAAPEKREQPV